MSNPIKIRGLMFGISVLPALLVMPAMAERTSMVNAGTSGPDLNTIVPDGIIKVDGNKAIHAVRGDSYLSTPNITIESTNYTKNGAIYADGSKTTLTLGGESTKDISVKSDQGMATNIANGAQLNISGENVTVHAKNRGLYTVYDSIMAVPKESVINVNAKDSMTISSDSDSAVIALANGSAISLTGKSIDISTKSATAPAVHAGNNTQTASGNTKRANVNLNADTVKIASENVAVSAMSQGIININGDAEISGTKAIVARGGAEVNINTDGAHTTQIDGNISFDFHEASSNTPIDANVNVVLNGADSSWTGNTMIAYDFGDAPAPDDSYLTVTGMNLTVANGAKWTATKIADNKGEVTGSYYTGLNNLNVDNGTIDIADAIMADNANINSAILNTGSLTINDSLVATGDITGTGALVIGQDATANIGDANINLASIQLDGTVSARLTDTNTAKFTATDSISGSGTVNMAIKSAGTYTVFDAPEIAFSGKTSVEFNNDIFKLDWSDDETSFTAKLKSVDEIASDNNLSGNAAQSVVNITNSTSDALNELSMRAQIALAQKDADSIEHAARAINPETASVTQSMASSVQNTVTSLAANRMSGMTIGRNGGDGDSVLTAGGVWAQGLFNSTNYSGQFDGTTGGVAVGLDGTFGSDWTVGIGYSFANSDVDATARNTEINSHTVFAYGQYKPSQWYANATLNYTLSGYTESGNALDLAVASEYDINAFGGQIATGYDTSIGITPELAVRYLHIGGADYENSLDVANSISDTNYLTGVLGVKYAFNFQATDEFFIRPELRAAVKYDMLSDVAMTTVTMPGVNAYVMTGERLSRLGGEFGLGLTMTYAGVDVSLNYDIEVRENYTSQTGMVRARYNF